MQQRYPPGSGPPARHQGPIAQSLNGISWAIAIPVAVFLGGFFYEAISPWTTQWAAELYEGMTMDAVNLLVEICAYVAVALSVRIFAIGVVMGLIWLSAHLIPRLTPVLG